MPNFYRDNRDIVDFFDNVDVRRLIMLQEDAYRQAKEYPHAPADYEDAMDSYRRVLDMVGRLAAEFIEPRAEEVDREGAHFEDGKVIYAKGMRESLEQLRKADLMGFTLPRKYGGLNLPILVYTAATEMVSRADASLMNIFGLQDIAETINTFASETIKQDYLPRFAAGEVTGAMVLTEPDAGSDLTNVQVRAVPDEDETTWRLHGVKRFITNGCAEVLLVLARSEPNVSGARGLSLFVSESDETVRVRRIEDKLGIHGSPTCELQFSGTPARLIGSRKRGLSTYVMALMNGARLAIAAQGIGIAQAALSSALDYAAARVQFGRPIRQFPAVRQMLADMHMKVEAARLLAYETAIVVGIHDNIQRLEQEGTLGDVPEGEELKSESRFLRKLAGALTPVAKYYATEICNQVCYDAIQVLGGSGYMRDYDVERYYRDARITSIYEGTTQIQHNAAVGYVVSGFFEDRFGQLHERCAGLDPDALAALEKAREQLRQAVEFVRGQGDDYRDLQTARLVQSATNIYIGYLLLEASARSPHKEALAGGFFANELPMVGLWCEQASSGDRTYLDRMPELLGYE